MCVVCICAFRYRIGTTFVLSIPFRLHTYTYYMNIVLILSITLLIVWVRFGFQHGTQFLIKWRLKTKVFICRLLIWIMNKQWTMISWPEKYFDAQYVCIVDGYMFCVINFVYKKSGFFMWLSYVCLCRVWSVQCTTFESIIRKPSEHIRNLEFVLLEKHESMVSTEYMANGQWSSVQYAHIIRCKR